jgi:hypothetical protein
MNTDEIRALRSLEEALLKAKDSNDLVDLERAHQKSGYCSNPQLRLITTGIMHGIGTIDDALSMVTNTLALEECA